jgi:TRAP-type C4-dicarboxylate transport system substrate-binding protein
MKRKLSVLLLAAATLMALPSLATVSAGEEATIRLGTLAPAGSSWDRVFKAWNNSLKEESKGTVKLQIYPGGSAGDERDVIRKMKVGQMDAGAFTSIGLSLVNRKIQVLQLPGLIADYKHLNAVRDALAPEFEGVFDEAGYKLVGWGDAGFARILSNKPILFPTDYKSVRPWVPSDDAALPVFMKMVGANPVAAGIPEVIAGLQTGMIDTVMGSAIAAVALQWFRNVKYVSKEVTVPVIGATLVRNEFFKALSPEQQEALMKTGKKAHTALLKLIEEEDGRAYKTLIEKAKLQEFSILGTPDQKKAWVESNMKLRGKLTGQLWSPEFYKKVSDRSAVLGEGRGFSAMK